MLPDPLHPAVVHFPIVLSVLLPISALGALWAIRAGVKRAHAWAFPVVIAAALTLAGWAAMETGEAQEERVEGVVTEQVLHAHEEAAERFLLFGGVATLVLAAGLAGGTLGTAARIVGTVGTVVVLWSGYQVGSAGGELVYVHGAASAYVDGGSRTAPPRGEGTAVRPSGERDDDGHGDRM
jgi:uncharacterized membrane protein